MNLSYMEQTDVYLTFKDSLPWILPRFFLGQSIDERN
jgi:hypothetical protein